MSEIKWRDLSFRESTSGPSTSRWTEVPNQPDLYEVLQVSSSANPEVIKAAHRALMERYHPDKHPEHRRPWADEIARRLNQAYAILSNPQKRREYDRNRVIGDSGQRN